MGITGVTVFLLTLTLMITVAVSEAAEAKTPADPAWPLKQSANKRYLEDRNGKPFLINADTVWGGPSKLKLEEWNDYLDKRKSQGFNTVQVQLLPLNNRMETNAYGDRAFTNQHDFSTRVEAYWEHIDRVIDAAEKKGLLLIANPIWLADFHPKMKVNGPERLREYGRFLGQRYGDEPHLIWMIGGDAWKHQGGSEDELEALAKGITETNKAKQLMTYHSATTRSSRDDYEGADWLTLNATYTYFPEHGHGKYQIYRSSIVDYNREPVMPFYLSEALYEGPAPHKSPPSQDYAPPHYARRQAYWPILSGATGHAYGSVNWEVPETWRKNLDLPGANDMKHLSELFRNRDWHKLVPDGLPDPSVAANHKVIVEGYGTYNAGKESGGDDYVTAARSTDGSLVMAYVPPTGTDERKLTVDMSRLSDNATARWFDPTDGTYQVIERNLSNNGTRTFTTPGKNSEGQNDWVLVIETKEKR